jgi:hypothetical protein
VQQFPTFHQLLPATLSPYVMQLYRILKLSLAELLILSQKVISQALQISKLANVFHTYKPIWDLNLVLKYLDFSSNSSSYSTVWKPEEKAL